MAQNANAKIPDISLASEPWVKEQLMDTENRIEKAFHDQTRYFDTKFERMITNSNEKLDTTVRWGIGLILTTTVALIIAVLIQPYIGPR